MLSLPLNIPHELRTELEQALNGKPFAEAVEAAAAITAKLLQATDVLCFVSNQSQAQEEQEIKICQTLRQSISANYETQLMDSWVSNGIHEKAMALLTNRYSAVSYSSFSWPFPHVASSENSTQLPREYSVFIPVSSALVVTAEGDIPFSGYIALMFDAFPQLGADAVELLILLPGLLSEITATFLRKDPPFVYHLLALKDGIVRHQQVMEDIFVTLQHGRTKERSRVLSLLNNSCQSLVENSKASGYLLHQRGKKATVHLQSLSIEELIAREIAIFLPLSQKAGVSLEVAENSGIAYEAYVDPTLFPAMLYNLIAYALEAASPGDNIAINYQSTSAKSIELTLTVTHLSRSANKTSSSNSHRTKDSHSLLIANQIAQACQCNLKETVSNSTTAFSIEVPIAALFSEQPEAR